MTNPCIRLTEELVKLNALKSANHRQDTVRRGPQPSPDADLRALALLDSLRDMQRGLPRSAALAWERTAFAGAFDDPEPARRVRAFLGGGK
jgi:hypothetical protein